MVCMSFGSCTVSIFSCPTPALGLGGPFFFFGPYAVLTLTLERILSNKFLTVMYISGRIILRYIEGEDKDKERAWLLTRLTQPR